MALTYLKLNSPSAFAYFQWSWSWVGLVILVLVLFASLPRLFGNSLNPNKVNPQISEVLRKFPRSGDTAIDSPALSILIFFCVSKMSEIGTAKDIAGVSASVLSIFFNSEWF